MTKRFSVTVSKNRTMKLISEATRYFRKRVALDLSFQSESRWDEKQSSIYMSSLISGRAPSKIIVANIDECLKNFVEDSKDFDYFNDWKQKDFDWISIDGNNRTITIDNYLKGQVKLIHGEYPLPDGVVVINSKNDTYDKHPKSLLKHIEENVELTVAEYITATRSDLSDIFRSVNDGIALNPQELRNAILVPYAKWVREMVQKYKMELKTIYSTNNNLTRRDIDEFIVSVSVYTTYSASHGVSKADKNDAYSEDSAVSKQTNNIAVSLDTMCKIIRKHATGAFKGKSTLFNLYMLIDEMRKRGVKILDTEKFYEWFISTEAHRLADQTILLIKPNGEHRTYESCCTSTSDLELQKRFEYLIKDLGSIDNNIAIELDKNRIFTKAQRMEMWKKQKGVCTVTGKKITESEINDDSKWSADHIKPHSMGGQTVVENGQLIAKIENLKKSNKFELGVELV